MKATTITTKGQVTIPADIRARLGLKPHDKVVFDLDGDTARLRKIESAIEAIYGSVQPRNRPEDFRKLREDFEQGVADEVMSETDSA
jgi:AbrB family looped-hinge helix DNA binding protein